MGNRQTHASARHKVKRGRAMDVNEFAARENLTRFRSELEQGVGESVRGVLLDLLVEQESLFGLQQEQLDRVNRHIIRLREIIAGQVQLMERLQSKGLALEKAQLVLDTLNDMMLAHQSFRQTILDRLAH
jgi:hypothetical protein